MCIRDRYCILSKESQEIFGFPTLGFYKDKMGLFEECQDISAVANLIGCKEEVLIETLRSYSNAYKIGNCSQTNKNIFPADVSPQSTDLIVGRITPSSKCLLVILNLYLTVSETYETNLIQNVSPLYNGRDQY